MPLRTSLVVLEERVALASERADMRRAIVSENRHRVASRLVRTDTFCEDISGKGPKEGDSRRLNHPPVAGTPKPNAKDDKTQFELKTALL